MNALAYPIGWIPLLPLLGALFAGLIGHKFSKRIVGVICSGAVFLSFVLSFLGFYKLLQLGHIPPAGVGPADSVEVRTLYYLQNTNTWTWINAGGLKIEMSFWMDWLNAVMALLVTFVGFLIHVFSVGYMAHDKAFARYFAYLNLFTASMLILVLGKNLLMLFIGWEGVGLCSYLLIGFWYEDNAKAAAGKKAFITNRIGDFGFVLGIFAIFACQAAAGKTLTLDYKALQEQGAIFANLLWTSIPVDLAETAATWDWTWATVIGLLLFIGACGKSAQVPLYIWLPDAMAGPTPVSALIHAATMVTAGVFMIARLGFLYAFTPEALAVVGLIGGITALLAAIIAVPQNDIKKVLAYSTVSQLGLMFVAMGTGAFWVGIFHVLTHAFFKACLFLGSGSVIHAMGEEQDIRKMGGLKKYMPITFWTFTISTFAISGFPFLAGFFSKDEILWQAYSTHNPVFPGLNYVIWGLAATASFLTAFYMTRLWVRTFLGKCRADEATVHHLHESPALMTGPLVILAFLAVVGGYMGLPKILTGGHTEKNAPEYPQNPTNLLQSFTEPALYIASERAQQSELREQVTPELEAEEHSKELGLMGFSILVALLGIGLGYTLYKDNKLPKAAPGYKLALNKFYVDEIYDFIIIKPLLGISYTLHLLIDEWIIDSILVRGGPRLIKLGSMGLRLPQTGNVQHYAIFLALGAAGILYLVVR
jgi:NADH-quinone oxidoreductase subunit L